MKFREVIIENIVIILLGASILYLDELEFRSAYSKILILTFALVKSVYFSVKGFRRILRFSLNNISYHQLLIFIAVNISLIVFSFAVDYFCLLQVDPSAFSGIDNGVSSYEKAFRLFCLSILIFSNLGVAKVIPESLLAETLMVTEAILSFITIIFILSDFASLKESLNVYAKVKKDKPSKHPGQN